MQWVQKILRRMKKMSNLHQVGGSHYERLKIQPINLFIKYNLNWFQGEAIKYVSRFPNKGGKEDLQKALHIMRLALENFGPLLWSSKEYQLVEEGSEPYIEAYTAQFSNNYFLEPMSFKYFYKFVYLVLSKDYKGAIEKLEILIYSEYE